MKGHMINEWQKYQNILACSFVISVWQRWQKIVFFSWIILPYILLARQSELGRNFCFWLFVSFSDILEVIMYINNRVYAQEKGKNSRTDSLIQFYKVLSLFHSLAKTNFVEKYAQQWMLLMLIIMIHCILWLQQNEWCTQIRNGRIT